MDALVFPVLAFDKHSFSVKRNEDDMTIVWSSLIRSGWFEELIVVDSKDRSFKVVGVTKLRGVGFLWGFNPLYGRRIKVKLDTRRSESDLSIEQLTGKLLALLRSWPGWQSRDDYEELVASIQNATSISQLIDSLSRFNV